MRYRDRDLLVTVLTPHYGVLRGVLRRARGGKAPQSAITQILSRVHLTAFLGARSELATYRQLDLITSSFPLARDLVRAAASAVVAELLVTFCPLGEPAPRRFRLGSSLLEALLGGTPAATVVAYAEAWMLALGGVLESPEDTALEEPARRFLQACRATPVAELDLPVPTQLASWLDSRVREEAERPLRALDFFRSEV